MDEHLLMSYICGDMDVTLLSAGWRGYNVVPSNFKTIIGNEKS